MFWSPQVHSEVDLLLQAPAEGLDGAMEAGYTPPESGAKKQTEKMEELWSP